MNNNFNFAVWPLSLKMQSNSVTLWSPLPILKFQVRGMLKNVLNGRRHCRGGLKRNSSHAASLISTVKPRLVKRLTRRVAALVRSVRSK
jgi:hypothetical protein